MIRYVEWAPERSEKRYLEEVGGLGLLVLGEHSAEELSFGESDAGVYLGHLGLLERARSRCRLLKAY